MECPCCERDVDTLMCQLGSGDEKICAECYGNCRHEDGDCHIKLIAAADALVGRAKEG